MKCKICGNSEGNKTYTVKEMMFGFDDYFTYVECAKCECLQLESIPENITKYYPPNYYSYAFEVDRYKSFFKGLLVKTRNQYAISGKGLLGKMLYKQHPREDILSLSKIDLNKNSSILDVGCGNGLLLYDLNVMGYKNTLGVDPYIERTIEYKNGVKVLKEELHNVKGQWKVIMLHHSLEHMDAQLSVMQSIHRMLDDQGVCIIRIPTVSSYAWKKYRTNWVSLDAPRHFYLHSLKSMEHLAGQAGLEVSRTYRDSSAFQIWGSEQYIKGIPLYHETSHYRYADSSKSVFTATQMAEFNKLTDQLVANQQGDTIVFYLRKKAAA